MTDIPQPPSNIDQQLLAMQLLAIQNTQAIAALTNKLDNLADNVADLTSNVNSVLARSAILDDVLLELRDSHEQQQRHFEQHQQNFEQHQRNVEANQRTTNAALERLEAILMQIVRRFD